MKAMSRDRRWRARLVIALIFGLSMFGCGSADTEGASVPPEAQEDYAPTEAQEDDVPGAPRDESGQDAPGAPVNGGEDHEAPGAPIMIPARIEDEGAPLESMRGFIESEIRKQCPGGRLCLRVRVEPRIPDRTLCTFMFTEPRQRSHVKQWTTVVIVTGVDPCVDEPRPGESEDPPVTDPTDPTVPSEPPSEPPSEEVPRPQTSDEGQPESGDSTGSESGV
jgi:hypothetical protein